MGFRTIVDNRKCLSPVLCTFTQMQPDGWTPNTFETLYEIADNFQCYELKRVKIMRNYGL